MEPVTHMLTGACISRSGMNRTTGLATLTMVIAAEIPDADFIWVLRGRLAYFAHHRGITHTLLASPLMAAVAVAAAFAFHRVWPRDARNPPRWGRLFFYAWLGVLSHILLDFTNSYGIRPFAPFFPRWFSWDIVYIVEPLFLIVLLAGLILPALFGLVQEEVSSGAQRGPRGRAGAIFALASMLAILALRDFEHRRAVAALNSLLYQQQTAIRVSAYPSLLNPFSWVGVAETASSYVVMRVTSQPPQADPENRAQTFYKPEASPALVAAKNSYLGRVYLDWAAYPLLEVEPRMPPEGGFTVRFHDLRFADPAGGNALGASLELDKNLNVTGESFLPRGGK